MFTIKSDYGLSEADCNKIIKWTKNILPEWNRLKESFYGVQSMMKPLSLGYQKNNMCPSFYMLYYLENTELIKYRTCGHARYKPKIDRGRTLITHKKLINHTYNAMVIYAIKKLLST